MPMMLPWYPTDPDKSRGCLGLVATALCSAGPNAGPSSLSEVYWQNLLWGHPTPSEPRVPPPTASSLALHLLDFF